MTDETRLPTSPTSDSGQASIPSGNDHGDEGQLKWEKYRYAGNVTNQSRQERVTLYNVFVVSTAGSTALVGFLWSLIHTGRPTSVFVLQLWLALDVVLILATTFSIGVFIRLLALGREYQIALKTMRSIEDISTDGKARPVPSAIELSGRVVLYVMMAAQSLMIGLATVFIVLSLGDALSFSVPESWQWLPFVLGTVEGGTLHWRIWVRQSRLM